MTVIAWFSKPARQTISGYLPFWCRVIEMGVEPIKSPRSKRDRFACLRTRSYELQTSELNRTVRPYESQLSASPSAKLDCYDRDGSRTSTKSPRPQRDRFACLRTRSSHRSRRNRTSCRHPDFFLTHGFITPRTRNTTCVHVSFFESGK